jgi:hypothetical protein
MQTKVVKILSDTAVVLGVGANQGVGEGHAFVIFEPGEEIIDPETKESLGSLEIVKGRVKVAHVMPQMCIARTERRTVTRTKTVSPLATVGFFPREEKYDVEVVEKLNVETVDEDFERKKTVRVGDLARSV